MTKLRNVLLVALFALSSLCGTTFAQRITNDRFPADARFDQLVTVDLPATGLDLAQYLRELASLVKLQATTEGIAAKSVTYNFKAIPFRQVWNIVVSLNNLDYELLPNDVVVVGPPEVVAKFRPATPAQTTPTTPPPPQPVLVVRTYDIKSNPDNVSKALSAQFADVKIVPVTGTSKLIITATETQHSSIAALLQQIDVVTAAPVSTNSERIVQQLYAVSYSKASRLAEILKQLVAGPSVTTNAATGTTTAVGTAAPGATAVAATPNVGIVADDQSNTLIIRGPEETVSGLVSLLPKLDLPQQLVNIGIRIQENSDSATRSLGVDWKPVGLGNFSGSIVGGLLNFAFDATNSLAGLNLTATLNALETQGLSRRINDSTLTVLNNGTGSVRSGGRIEISIPSTTTNIEKTLTFGVKIDVSPTIAADGSITLDLNAEVSSVQNAANPNPNRIDFVDNVAKSVVRLKSGQTLLLASLLATTQDSTTSGVPVLSAIPLLGDLFKTTKTTDDQKQLLVVITADIIK
ncbi:MAG: type II secretion system protein GspD [Deinococcales bacterium]